MPDIRLHLTDQLPSRVAARIERSVRALLEHTDPRYLAGLGSILLRDGGGLTWHERQRRRRKVGKRLLGNYNARKRGEPAYIVLFIDAIQASGHPVLMRFGFSRNAIVGRVLFHEIGHHVATFVVPEHGSSEGLAEQWTVRLGREYLRRRYGGWRLTLLKALARALRAILPRRRGAR